MGNRYIMRLDDAAERMDVIKWNRMETLLDKYDIKPIVGVIPKCEDPQMKKYAFDNDFWNKVSLWRSKDWVIAMHGYRHLYDIENGGVNPVNRHSEFAGHDIEEQKIRLRRGNEIFKRHGIEPEVFFAPAHTFDKNTIKALSEETDIRIISDTIAWDTYYEKGFFYIPQQAGRVRKLPFSVCTFCYHPNVMKDADFFDLENFLKNNYKDFTTMNQCIKKRKKNIFDMILKKTYFLFRKLRHKV